MKSLNAVDSLLGTQLAPNYRIHTEIIEVLKRGEWHPIQHP